MIISTQLRPDRFNKVISGEKKEHRIPFDYLELTEKRYEVVIYRTGNFKGAPEALVELLSIERDEEKQEYVLKLGKIKSTNNIQKRPGNNFINRQFSKKKTDKKYIQKCEILRDGHKVGILNVSTKQGQKQRQQLGRLQGYSFRDLPLEIITV